MELKDVVVLLWAAVFGTALLALTDWLQVAIPGPNGKALSFLLPAAIAATGWLLLRKSAAKAKANVPAKGREA